MIKKLQTFGLKPTESRRINMKIIYEIVIQYVKFKAILEILKLNIPESLGHIISNKRP